MNVFHLDIDVANSAKFHMDKHVVCMIKEAAQVMCGAIHKATGVEVPYSTRYQNNPIALWLNESQGNYLYLAELAKQLNKEYKFRYGYIDPNDNHASYEVIKSLKIPTNIPNIGRTLPPLLVSDECLPSSVQNWHDVVAAYRRYYLTKVDIASWTNRDKPYWWVASDY